MKRALSRWLEVVGPSSRESERLALTYGMHYCFSVIKYVYAKAKK